MRHSLKQTLYEQLENLPEGLTGEILNGQLLTQPRPTGPHALVESNLQIELGGPFGKGRGGPGGWWMQNARPWKLMLCSKVNGIS